jgi:chromosome segregation ATPase
MAVLLAGGSVVAQAKGLLDQKSKQSLMVVVGNVNAAVERFDALVNQQGSAGAQLVALEAKLQALGKELQEAQNRRRRLEDLDIQDPGSVNPASLQRLRAQTDSLVNDRRELISKINALKANSAAGSAEREELRLQVARAQGEYDTLVNFFIDKINDDRKQRQRNEHIERQFFI